MKAFNSLAKKMFGTSNERVVRIFSSEVLQTILDLPGAPKSRFWNARGGRSRTEIQVQSRQLLADWLAGDDIASMCETHLAEIQDVEYRFEQLGDYISDVFEMYLPWILTNLVVKIFTVILPKPSHLVAAEVRHQWRVILKNGRKRM